ncbi:hypothetical protein [Moorella sp. Hama-1]|uniref:hypothetical protein n=1 Tax=Moorella sp. Hama-1 TaxID=2138101 RepID=UPI00137AA7DF|nr:hypothetical protein [Moorella sp. Hama-1]
MRRNWPAIPPLTQFGRAIADLGINLSAPGAHGRRPAGAATDLETPDLPPGDV